MRKEMLQRRETLLLETLLSGLDARESAKEVSAPMLIYLSDLLVKRAKEELDNIRLAIEEIGEDTTNGDIPV